MDFSNSPNKISLNAHAKINLFLAITGKRSDGFHEINSVMAKIALFYQLTIEKIDKLDQTICECSNSINLSGIDNIAYIAVSEWRKITGDRSGVRVIIDKKIPVQGGLGGGSSNAVSTLIGLNQLFGQLLSNKEVLCLAQKIGSDCSFFLTCGLASVSGRGENSRDVSFSKSDTVKGSKVLIIQQPIGFSTNLLYRDFSAKKDFSNKSWAEEKIRSWEKGDIPTSDLLYNDFEKVIFEKYLFFKPLFTEMMDLFGLQFNISGSGSCFFCLLDRDIDEFSVIECAKKYLGENLKSWITSISY